MVLYLTQKLHDSSLKAHELETILRLQGYYPSTYDVWQGGIIDKTTTPHNTYKGNWQIHQHQEQKDQYAAIIHRGAFFQGIYEVDISKLIAGPI